MDNSTQVQVKKIGEKAINSSFKRAELQNSSNVESRLFIPHIASEKEKNIVNHQNYFRS